MSLETNDLQTLVSNYMTMDIEKLKANIFILEEKSDCSLQTTNLDFAINELELKYKEREEQIDLLTKSLTSSSRINRWFSSFKAVINKLVVIKNKSYKGLGGVSKSLLK
jgi:predicted RNase H-like nuclease (RuvC/YqgF family)